ncbi:Disks large-like 5 [Cricetulus griseus]|uniref:Disks large-like 5 n=1 Tax=Cricetulus griseus TaxID=10029 RepID=G3ICG6_CRIGR|nr:Disks large-like 5 [Cricetulus griseus]
MEELTLQLKKMTYERDELSVILTHYTSNDWNNRLNSELEMVKMEHQKEMSDMKKFPKEISEALCKCKVLTEKTNSYSIHHSQLLSEWTQLKEKVSMLKEDNRKLKREQILLQESCEEAKRLCKESYEKIYDLWTKQQQDHEILEENLLSLMKQKELVTQQRDLAVKLQHHFTESQMRFEHLQHELEQTTAQEESLLQTELLQQEHCVPGKLNSELEILKMERQKEMSDMKKFPKEISEALSKCKVLTEKNNSYSTHHSQLLSECTQLKEKVSMLKEDNRKLKREQILLQESCEEAKRLCKESYEKICDLWTKQQQEHERLEENLLSLMKQKELVTQQRDLAVKLQHHFTESRMRFEHLQHELEQTTDQEESLLQTELLQQEHCVPGK